MYLCTKIINKQNEQTARPTEPAGFNMKNLHALEIKFYPVTNNSGARVGIISKRFRQRVTIDFGYEYNTTTEVAINYLTNKGFNIVAKADFGETDILLSDTFEPLK